MDLQISVMNLPTNLKLTAQHILNKDLEVTRYPINLTAIITSATSLKGALQVTRVNQKLTLLELWGEIKVGILWSWWHWEDSSKNTSDFILTVPLSLRHLQFHLFCLSFFSMSHLFLYTALPQGERINHLPCHHYLKFFVKKRVLKGCNWRQEFQV